MLKITKENSQYLLLYQNSMLILSQDHLLSKRADICETR